MIAGMIAGMIRCPVSDVCNPPSRLLTCTAPAEVAGRAGVIAARQSLHPETSPVRIPPRDGPMAV
jgi:hypothetical protein